MKIEGIDWNTLAISEMTKDDFINSHLGQMSKIPDDKDKKKVLSLIYERCCKEHNKKGQSPYKPKKEHKGA